MCPCKIIPMSISISAKYTYHDLMWMTSSLYQNNSFLLIFSRDRKCLKICDYIIHGWKTNLLTYISPFLIWCWKLTFVSYNQLWAITRLYWARTLPHTYLRHVTQYFINSEEFPFFGERTVIWRNVSHIAEQSRNYHATFS